MKTWHITLFLIFLSCSTKQSNDPLVDLTEDIESSLNSIKEVDSVSLIILGTVQDAGSPQINCQKDCCAPLHQNPDPNRMVVSLGLIDPENEKKFIFEATPDMPRQLAVLSDYESFSKGDVPDGIFLTHAHIGHYTGLMYFGKEAMNAKEVLVYSMPRMATFLKSNGPWKQLVDNKNILLQTLKNEEPRELSSNISVIPFLVPHRDEYSETVGYKIIGPNKSALFIPDIDKWHKWDKSILDEIKKIDYAFIDATFYDQTELPNRNMSEIPHPFAVESMDLFKNMSIKEKSKVIFIHLNHTNPLLNSNSDAYQEVLDAGFKIAEFGEVYSL